MTKSVIKIYVIWSIMLTKTGGTNLEFSLGQTQVSSSLRSPQVLNNIVLRAKYRYMTKFNGILIFHDERHILTQCQLVKTYHFC